VLENYRHNLITNNTANANNYSGIYLYSSSNNNNITNNNVNSNSNYGLLLWSSSNNCIYHNNLINNTDQGYDNTGTNSWDNGYPSGGNYWSDYTENYPDAEELNESGIWNTPYDILGDAGAQDRYPLMNPSGEELIISELIPHDSAILSSNDVLFSWRTSVNSTTEVYIKAETEATFTQVIGDSGFIHAVTISNLTRNTNYEWYVRSCSACGCAVSATRTFYIDNGIVFTKDRYEFTVERDYDQHVSVSVKNMDSEPHDLLVQAMNPYEDLIVGFVGNGSVDEIISLAPGETEDIEFVIHAQDAMLREYEFPVNLTNIGVENITDFAIVRVNIRVPNIDFNIVEVDSDPVTLVKTFRITNYGDTITDLKVFVGDELEDKIIFEPSIDHGRLGSGRIVDLTAKLGVKAGCVDGDCYGINGTIFAQGAGQTVNVSANFTCEEGKKIFEGHVQNLSINFSASLDNDDSPNTNPLSVVEADTYLLNGTHVFKGLIGINVHQNQRPIYDVNVSLIIWNETSELRLYGITDIFGMTLFDIYGPLSDTYHYKAELVDHNISTPTREFSCNETPKFEVEPNGVKWLAISDRDSSYNLTSDGSGDIELDNSPFSFEANYSSEIGNVTAVLYIQPNIPGLDRDILSLIRNSFFVHVKGVFDYNKLSFNTDFIPPGNYTATIVAFHPSEYYAPMMPVSFSKPINISVLEDYKEKSVNLTWRRLVHLNSTHYSFLKVQQTVIESDENKTMNLYYINTTESEYIFSIAITSKQSMDDILMVSAKDKNNNEIFNLSKPIYLDANITQIVNFTIPIDSSINDQQINLSISTKHSVTLGMALWFGGGFIAGVGLNYLDKHGHSCAGALDCGLGLINPGAYLGSALYEAYHGYEENKPLYTLKGGTRASLTWYYYSAEMGYIAAKGPLKKAVPAVKIFCCAKETGEFLYDAFNYADKSGLFDIFKTHNWYCNNRPNVESSVDISDSIKEEDVKAAHLITNYELPWSRGSYRPHDVYIKINGREVGNLTNTIPEGPYKFTFDPSFLNYPTIGVAKNTIALDTRHMNGGHYVVSGDMKIILELKDTTMIVCASNQSEADELIKQRSDLFSHKPDFAVHPAHIEFSNNYPVEGEEVNITAKIYNFGTREASDVLVQFLDNGVEIGRVVGYMPKICHEDIFANYSWKCTQGWHNITVKINPDRTISELDSCVFG